MKAKIREINVEGFQVVSAEMFIKNKNSYTPICTLWPDSISFNKFSLDALNLCEGIRIEVNVNSKQILIIPATSRDPDCVQWMKSKNKTEAKKIPCVRFVEPLYTSWGLERDSKYRACG